MTDKLRDDLADRLYSRCIPVPECGCLIWEGPWNSNGYGTVSLGGSMRDSAHRISYRVSFGEIPKGMFVCHRCDTPACINPSHLFLGTNLDNIADRDRKKRFARSFGESNPFAKLTAAKADAIRSDKRPQRVIAKEYGVGQQAIWSIRNNVTWRVPAMRANGGEVES